MSINFDKGSTLFSLCMPGEFQFSLIFNQQKSIVYKSLTKNNKLIIIIIIINVKKCKLIMHETEFFFRSGTSQKI